MNNVLSLIIISHSKGKQYTRFINANESILEELIKVLSSDDFRNALGENIITDIKITGVYN